MRGRRVEDNTHTHRGYGLPTRRMCGKVHRDLSDAIGPIAATYAPLTGCRELNLGCIVMNLSIFVSKEFIYEGRTRASTPPPNQNRAETSFELAIRPLDKDY